MTQEQKMIRAKVGLLELAKPLGNVSRACKMMGCSRDSRFKELYDKGGELALQEISRRKPCLKNRTPADIERAVVDLVAGPRPAAGRQRSAACRSCQPACAAAAPRPDVDEASARRGAHPSANLHRHLCEDRLR